MPIHEKIKKLRQTKNLSQLAIAEKLHISQNAYSLIENGKTKIDEERIIQLGFIFDVHPFELFIDENESVKFNALKGRNNDIQSLNEYAKDLIKHLNEQLIQKDQQIDKLLRRNEMLFALLDLSHKSELLPHFADQKFKTTTF